MVTPSQIAKDACEKILIDDRRYNFEHNIWPSQVVVVDRLLSRSNELLKPYQELHRKLHRHPRALLAFFDVLLGAAALWNPEKIALARAARAKLIATNGEIALKAAELEQLLRQRERLHDTSGFSSGTHYHVVELIEAAAQDNYLFRSHVQEPLCALRFQFDLKYWPGLPEVMQALARDAQAAATNASDPVTAAATAGRRASLVDFFKAFFAGIEENGISRGGFLPSDINFTDATFAALVNCALDLTPEESVDGPYVKRLRQGMRDMQKAAKSREQVGDADYLD